MSHSAVTPYLYKGDKRVPLANHTQVFRENFQRHQKFPEPSNHTTNSEKSSEHK